MLIWLRDDDLGFLDTADNGNSIWAYVCFAPQNEQDLIDLKEFVEAHGRTVIWEHEDEIRDRLNVQENAPESESGTEDESDS